MTLVTSSDLLPQIDVIRNNAPAMQRLMLQKVEIVSDGGIAIVDATNPFVNLMEGTVTLCSAAIAESDANTRKQYASAAITMDELYLHMSDKDFLDRFATPSRTTITVLLGIELVKQKAVSVVPSLPADANGVGLRKITIPRHSEFKVADLLFTMQYPIDILVTSTGGINVVYDVSRPSPLYQIENNQLSWQIAAVQGSNYLAIDIPITQFQISTNQAQMNAITGFSKSYPFTDNFYYCRVFNKNNNETEWHEVLTTHTEQVYDQKHVTAVLKVVDNTLVVQIPQIYFNNDPTANPDGHVRDTLRIDIYTTKGVMEASLANYNSGSFSARWLDRDEENGGKYSAPLNAFPALGIFSTASVTGGAGPLSFDELRERVVSRSVSTETQPITPNQLSNALSDLGYQQVVNVDNVTNRQLLATRTLPAPSDGSTITGAGCAMRTFQSKLETLAALDTGSLTPILDPISNNGIRLTIKPSMIYRDNVGVLSTVPVADVNAWFALTPDSRAIAINDDSLLYSPFYYVLDTTENQFQSRAYRLNKPAVKGKFFVAGHETSGTVTSTIAQTILMETTGKGYNLVVEIAADDAIKNLVWEAPPGPGLPGYQKPYLQLSYVPPGSSTRVYFYGTLISRLTTTPPYRPVDDRYIYLFSLDTAFDVDNKHRLILEQSGTTALLTTTFDLTISLSNYRSDLAKKDIQTIVDPLQFPIEVTDYLGVAWERLTVKFGEHLSGLWTRSRSLLDSVEYEKYSADVYSSYLSTVYDTDVNGNPIIGYDELTDTITYTVLHWPGEPYLTSGGETAYGIWLGANPTSDSNIFDWIATLTNADRVTFITNLNDIYIGPNSTDIPTLTVGGQAAYDAWLTTNPTSPSDIFDWWDTLTLPQKKSYWVVLHAEGDTIIGLDGNPNIVGGTRGIIRQFDMLMVDGRYYFADNETTVKYVTETVDRIVYWTTVDIPGIQKNLLERTELSYYPIATIGSVNGLVGQNENAILPANQELSFTYQLTDDAYNNANLKESIESNTSKIAAAEMQNRVVAASSLITKLKTSAGDSVIDVKMEGFLDDVYPAITLSDNSMRLTIGKRLVPLSNKTLIVQDSLTCSFTKHS